uniref:Uncharacterized protein n=1 Tax=Plectus sambesii TaxID=2011161 RepID=A0A914UWW0_9BILA
MAPRNNKSIMERIGALEEVCREFGQLADRRDKEAPRRDDRTNVPPRSPPSLSAPTEEPSPYSAALAGLISPPRTHFACHCRSRPLDLASTGRPSVSRTARALPPAVRFIDPIMGSVGSLDRYYTEFSARLDRFLSTTRADKPPPPQPPRTLTNGAVVGAKQSSTAHRSLFVDTRLERFTFQTNQRRDENHQMRTASTAASCTRDYIVCAVQQSLGDHGDAESKRLRRRQKFPA